MNKNKQMAPKKLDDLLSFEDTSTDYDLFTQLLKQVNLDSETDVDLVRKAFNKTKSVAFRLNEEFKMTVDFFEKETRDSAKKSKI